MKLIVGLGNPGLRYENTRHNLGAKVLKIFAKENKAKFKLERSLKSMISVVGFGDSQCLLAVPATFMNLSGEAVGLLLKIHKIPLGNLLVVHDDMDLELGVMRFKKQGSSGGHKGVDSIIKKLGTEDFNRLKLGVGKSSLKEATRDNVLSDFSRSEQKVISGLLNKTVHACQSWVRFGIDRAMNDYNKKDN